MANPVEQAKEQMNKSVENTKENFAGIRTGRANPALLNGIVVDYYGAPTPLKAVASIGVPEPRTLSVTPFDVSQASKVEKALRDSDLGVNPNRDGNVIRITMPELTSERRKEYVKLANVRRPRTARSTVRNIRRKAKETIDKSVKDGEMGEDEAIVCSRSSTRSPSRSPTSSTRCSRPSRRRSWRSDLHDGIVEPDAACDHRLVRFAMMKAESSWHHRLTEAVEHHGTQRPASCGGRGGPGEHQ